MSDPEGNLMGIVWLGEEQIPSKDFMVDFNEDEFGITFAIRIYEGARGKGLANRFMKEAIAIFKSTEKYRGFKNKGIWLEVTHDNIPAVRAYERSGFKRVTDPDGSDKILMILPGD